MLSRPRTTLLLALLAATCCVVGAGCGGASTIVPPWEPPDGWELAGSMAALHDPWPYEADRACMGFTSNGRVAFYLLDEHLEDAYGESRRVQVVALDLITGERVVSETVADERDDADGRAEALAHADLDAVLADRAAPERAGLRLEATVPLLDQIILNQRLGRCHQGITDDAGMWTAEPGGEQTAVWVAEDGSLRVGNAQEARVLQEADAAPIDGVYYVPWADNLLVVTWSDEDGISLHAAGLGDPPAATEGDER